MSNKKCVYCISPGGSLDNPGQTSYANTRREANVLLRGDDDEEFDLCILDPAEHCTYLLDRAENAELTVEQLCSTIRLMAEELSENHPARLEAYKGLKRTGNLRDYEENPSLVGIP